MSTASASMLLPQRWPLPCMSEARIVRFGYEHNIQRYSYSAITEAAERLLHGLTEMRERDIVSFAFKIMICFRKLTITGKGATRNLHGTWSRRTCGEKSRLFG